MNRDELRKLAAEYKIPGRGKMTKMELEDALKAEGCDLLTADENTELRKSSQSVEQLPLTSHRKHKMQTMAEAYDAPKRNRSNLVNGKPMTTHYKGRAIGAKHYRLLAAISDPEYKRVGERKRFNAATPMPNSERVQNYARSRETVRCPLPSVDMPKLTPRQMRRVLKHHTQDDGLRIRPRTWRAESGQTYLARTPEGFNIAYRYVND